MKALSIEEVKQLKYGDWVWVVDKDDAYRSGEEPCGEYYKVSSSINHHYLEVSSNGTNNYYKFYYEDYCKTWLAYKNKEQAECKGELVELLCKVGDAVYIPWTFDGVSGVAKGCIKRIELSDSGISYCTDLSDNCDEPYFLLKYNNGVFNEGTFNRTWFLDVEQAEQKLKEL